jgi:poly-gamma-glutamate capsule biosynthesis protein CapA/YwtB (metallophosphatase superfamily)
VSKAVTLLAVGDVGAKRPEPISIFRGCRDVLRSGDVVFAQLETTVTDRGAQAPNARLAMRAPPLMASAVRDAGINVMSFAGNHCLDWGYEGFADTLRHMADAGVALCGAGATLAAAREPAIVEHDGVRFAFLAYSSILPEGYRAEQAKPGCTPMRAHTFYEQVEHDQPGTPARTISHAHREDLAALIADVRVARANADLVIVSMHWGIHMVEATIADYQREVAYAAIDAGADAIIGHHPHILKGIEYYSGAPILYSLGNFAIEQPHVWDPAITETDSFRHLVSLNPSWDRDAVYMLPEDTRMTGVVRFHCNEDGIRRTEFLPAWIEDDSAPVMLAATDPRFTRVADYLARISKSENLNVDIERDGDVLRLMSV